MTRRVSLTVGLCALLGCLSPQPTSDPATGGNGTAPATTQLAANARLLRVIDGDTIDVVLASGGEERVRLIGIDTPESVDRDGPVECFGREASAFTASLFDPDHELFLERDLEARDQYGRLLAYIYRLPDGMFVNLEIVRQGFAQPFTFPTNSTHAEEFVAAARAAEAADVGLWGSCTDGTNQ